MTPEEFEIMRKMNESYIAFIKRSIKTDHIKTICFILLMFSSMLVQERQRVVNRNTFKGMEDLVDVQSKMILSQTNYYEYTFEQLKLYKQLDSLGQVIHQNDSLAIVSPPPITERQWRSRIIKRELHVH